MNTQLRQRDFSLFTLHFSLFTPKKSPRVRRVTGEYSQDTIKKYRKTEQLSVFLYFRLSQLRSLKGTKKEGNLHRKLPSSLSSLLSDSNQRPRDYKSRALAN